MCASTSFSGVATTKTVFVWTGGQTLLCRQQAQATHTPTLFNTSTTSVLYNLDFDDDRFFSE
jgi:hypothetical protein